MLQSQRVNDALDTGVEEIRVGVEIAEAGIDAEIEPKRSQLTI